MQVTIIYNIFSRCPTYIPNEWGNDGNKAVGRIEITNELNVAEVWRVSDMKNRDITILHLGSNVLRNTARDVWNILKTYLITRRETYFLIPLTVHITAASC